MTHTSLRPGSAPSPTFTITANFTAEPILEVLAFWGARLGFGTATFTFSSYNQVLQALMDPASALAARTPGANFLLVRTEEWAHDLHEDEAAAQGLPLAVDTFVEALRAFAVRAARPTFLALLPPSLETRQHAARVRLIADLDARIAAAASGLRAIRLVPAEEIERLYPVTHVDDPAARRLGHVPFTTDYWTALGTTLMRQARALLHSPAKLAIVDADHTLWGGVVGEAGPGQVDVAGPWRAFQEMLIERKRQGLLLAIVSKNRLEDVTAVLARPDNALRAEDFVAIRASWEPKSTQIRAIVSELDLGLASCVFLDDNPAECAEVAANCPEVTVLRVPADASELPAFAAHLWPLDLPPATAADADRTEQYRQQAERRQFRGAAASFREFIDRLELEVSIAPVAQDQIDRAAQLTQRTNQFNASGIRRTAAELGARLAAGGCEAHMVRVRDRFGDYGDVGLCLTERRGSALVVETFLLSCRVLGKGVEHRLLAAIGEMAAAGGADEVSVPFVRTARNEPAERFLTSVARSIARARADASEGMSPDALVADGAYRFPTAAARAVRFEPADPDPRTEDDRGSDAAAADVGQGPRREEEGAAAPVDARAARDGGDVHAASADEVTAGDGSTDGREPHYAEIATSLRTVRAIADRIAVAAAATRPALETGFVAPRTPIEAALAAIWARVLRLDRVGVEDRFFDLGGDSILGIQIIAQAAQQGLRFTLRDQFERPTIAALADVVVQTTSSAAARQEPVTGGGPLTAIQRWFFEKALPDPAHWNMELFLESRQPLDPDRLAAALAAIIRHHDALRLRFTRAGDVWTQEHAAADSASGSAGAREQGTEQDEILWRRDVSALPREERERAARHEAARAQASLNLAEGPLLRAVWFDHGAEAPNRLLLVIHHLVVDGITWRVLIEDLQQAYRALAEGRPIALPAKTLAYVDWARHAEAAANEGDVAGEADYWRRVALHGVEADDRLPIEEPTGVGRDTEDTVRVLLSSLDAQETRALLQDVPKAYRTQINDVLLTALLLACRDWTGRDTLRLDLEGHGRETVGEPVDVSRTAGWFTSILPVVLALPASAAALRAGHDDYASATVGSAWDGTHGEAEARAMGDALRAVKARLRATPNRGVGYGLLRYLSRDAALRAALAAQPPADVLFNYLGQFDQVLPADGLFRFADSGRSGAALHGARGRRSHAIEIIGWVRDERLTLEWTTSRACFPGEAIPRLAARVQHHLRRLIAHGSSVARASASAMAAAIGAGASGSGAAVSAVPSSANGHAHANGNASVAAAAIPTLAAGAAAADPAVAAAAAAAVAAATAADRDDASIEDRYPCTPLQQGMLLQSLQLAGSGVAFEQDIFELRGALDAARFAEAWRDTLQRHEVLRTTFELTGVDEPQQLVHAEARLDITFTDWRELAPSARQARLDEAMRAERARPFDLATLPLMRLRVYRTADAAHLLVWHFHHAILDGWSLPTVLRDVLRAYAGADDARPERQGQGRVAPPARRYRDYIDWLRRQDAAADERFWRQTLAGVTAATPLTIDHRPSTLPSASVLASASASTSTSTPTPMQTSTPTSTPTAGARPGASAAASAAASGMSADQLSDETWRRASHRLDPARGAALQAFARAHGLTVGTLFNGAWALLLARYAGVEDVTFGCTVAGRPAALVHVEAMVGLFINTLPLRVAVPAEAPVLDWLRDVQRRVLDLAEHQHSPLVDVQRWSGVPAGQPIAESLVVIENYPGVAIDPRESGGLDLTYEPWRRHSKTGFPLTLLATLDPAIRLQLWYDARRFDAARIEALLGHLDTLLASIIVDPSRATGDLPLITEAERTQILVDWNATMRAYPRDVCLHTLIAAQAARTPEATAVTFGSQRLTYGELEARAETLARWLRARGVGAGTRVALAVERSLEMVVGLLGVLKAGGTYVPIDPGYPRDRLAFMLTDCAAPILLTQAHLVAHLPPFTGAVARLDEEWERIEREAASLSDASSVASAPAVTAEDPVYMIYTSGSTGRPKGALNSHRGIVNRLLWMQEAYRLTPADAVLQKTPFSFDVSVWEFFWPLLAGARLVVAEPGGHQNPDYLARTIAAEQITVLHFVPSMLRVFLEAPGAAGCRSLRDVICSGEALPADLVRAFHAVLPARLHNLYGPTEAAVDVTHWTCPRDPDLALVPIGRPVANTQCYILDRRGQPVPVGVPGELHLGGVQVGLGYHGRPELTAEKFVADPFRAETDPRARLYKTGDLCRYLPDGAIEYLGRLDFQVKIRGFRIELGEIEAAIAAHAAIRDVIVIAREDAADDRQLVAYIVASSDLPAEALRAHLAPRLPDYMIPAQFVTLDRLPLSPNGKVDRKALPKPAAMRQAQTAFVPPATVLEQQIAAIWSEVLGLPQVGTRDNFFEAGGQSLKLMRVHFRLRERLGRDLPIVVLFQHPTIASLAAFLASEAGAEGDALAGAGVAAASQRAAADARQDRAAQQREAARRMQQANQARRRS